jgi:hypothetical protein
MLSPSIEMFAQICFHEKIMGVLVSFRLTSNSSALAAEAAAKRARSSPSAASRNQPSASAWLFDGGASTASQEWNLADARRFAGMLARIEACTKPTVARVQGAALGARLKEIEARWLASDLRLTRADFLD